MHAVPMNGKQPAGHYKNGSMTYRMTGKMMRKKLRFRNRKREEQSARFRQLLLVSFHPCRSWHFFGI